MIEHGDPDTETLLTGRDRSPEPRRRVRAGDLELELDGPDVRDVSYRGIEVVGQIYVAVRDVPWNTLPGVLADVSLGEGPGASFAMTYRSQHRFPALDIDLEVVGSVAGSAAGELRYDIDVVANSPIEYNRIGLNVLHGARTYAGRPYVASLRRQAARGHLPASVGPQSLLGERLTGLFPPFDRLELSPVDGVTVELAFEGDEFETEDQRNFADSTFKTYSTPLQRAAPFRLEAGERLRQSVTVRVRDDRAPGSIAIRRPDRERLLVLALGQQPGVTLPPVGLGQVDDDTPLSGAERARITPLQPDHLRVELAVLDGADRNEARLAVAAAEARALDCDLWVDVAAGRDDRPALAGLVRIICASEPAPRVIHLATPIAEPPDAGISGEMLAEVRQVAAASAPGVLLGAGAFMFFADLNRAPFDGAAVGNLTFPASPTVHRSDDDTVMDNVDRLGDEIARAREYLGARRLSVGPITLATRRGPYPDGPRQPGDLPARVDRRQMSLTAAAYTAGSLAAFSYAGADALTYFETAGWLGVAERDAGSYMPQRFRSMPGSVFPLWHVLADAAEWRGAQLLSVEMEPKPTFTRTIAALAVRDAAGTHLLVASLRRSIQRVTLVGLPAGGATIRALDTSTTRVAMTDPSAFRGSSASRPVRGGTLDLELPAYATVRVDLD